MKRLLRLNRSTPRNETIAGFRVASRHFGSVDFLFNEIFLRLEYHFTAGRTDPFIIDCGSNIGMSVLFFKFMYPDARITAFEPAQATFALLEENVRCNGLTRVKIHRAALARTDTMADLFIDRDNVESPQQSLIRERMPKDRETVQAVRLSSYIDRPVDFLKLDVEGSEMEVLRELEESGKLLLIQQMVVEYHHHLNPGDDTCSELLSLLEKSGFRYQLATDIHAPLAREMFQDVLVYAYRIPPAGAAPS